MLSVLIPIYNFDCRAFIQSINKQASECNIPFEIRCYDDGSNKTFKDLNSSLSGMSNVIYTEMPNNMGRSAIRNKLGAEAIYKHLLFMDCDSSIEQSDFISNYIHNLNENRVVYGGRSYEKNAPVNKAQYLRWFYGIKREVKNVAERAAAPYKSFMTNNFVISKALFQSILFNTELTGYGHEDTLFGYQLEEKKINILHIENPLCHIGLESSEEFIKKTAEGIKNLAFVYNKQWPIGDVKLLNTYKKISALKLGGLILFFGTIFEKSVTKNLVSDKPNLSLFDFYKLLLLCREMNKK